MWLSQAAACAFRSGRRRAVTLRYPCGVCRDDGIPERCQHIRRTAANREYTKFADLLINCSTALIGDTKDPVPGL